MFLLCSLLVDLPSPDARGSPASHQVAASPPAADNETMIDDREIQDTESDRRAMQFLLRSFPESGVDPMTAPVAEVDALWRRMAIYLARASETEFDKVLNAVRQDRAAAETGAIGSDAALRGAERAEELMTLIIEWRHGTWESAEVAAGRDPHSAA